jgi:folate-binding protein YgfZ
MPETTLYPTFSALGVPTAEYRGATTAARFAAPEAEFRALLEGCGVFDLGWRARARVEGKDRVRWLNGMVSNNVRDLGAGRGVYAFVLNPQGRIQGDLYAFNLGDWICLEIDAAQTRLFESLKRYIIMDQVTLSETSDQTGIGVQGPQAAERLRKLGISRELAELEVEQCNFNGADIRVIRMDAPLSPAFQIVMASHEAPRVWQSLINAGATAVGSAALELMRIAGGIPAYGQDIRDRDLPQETGQLRALSFTKGCYIGQEIVERIRSRGQVHRQFTGILFEGGLPEPGTKIEAAGKEVGQITSVAMLPLTRGPLAVGLGYIRREAMEAELTAGGSRARVSPLPFAAEQKESPKEAPTSAA